MYAHMKMSMYSKWKCAFKGQIQVKDKLALKWPGYNADMASDFIFCQNLIKLKEDQI